VAVNISITHLNIADWVKGLEAIPERDFTLETVQDYVVHHAVLPDSLKQYCFFSKGNYTRNLIFKNSVFECMTVCWEIGQKSAIHNHRGQRCWMGVAYGRVQVQNFRLVSQNPSTGFCELAPTTHYILDAAGPAEVDPDEPNHMVVNPSSFGSRAVTLHIYSRPFDMCEVYDLQAKRYQDVKLMNTSEFGRLTADLKVEKAALS